MGGSWNPHADTWRTCWLHFLKFFCQQREVLTVTVSCSCFPCTRFHDLFEKHFRSINEVIQPVFVSPANASHSLHLTAGAEAGQHPVVAEGSHCVGGSPRDAKPAVSPPAGNSSAAILMCNGTPSAVSVSSWYTVPAGPRLNFLIGGHLMFSRPFHKLLSWRVSRADFRTCELLWSKTKWRDSLFLTQSDSMMWHQFLGVFLLVFFVFAF